MKAQFAHVRAYGAVPLINVETAIHLNLSQIVKPEQAEHEDALGFDDPLDR
jgi:hypothetical protein